MAKKKLETIAQTPPEAQTLGGLLVSGWVVPEAITELVVDSGRADINEIVAKINEIVKRINK